MKKITIIFMSILMIFASCSTDIPYEDINENIETVEEPKEDDAENNTEEPSNEESNEDDSENDNDEEGNSENIETVEEPSNEESNEDDSENDNDEEGNSENIETVEEPKEDDAENEDVENKTWCEIGEDTKILGLNYFVCVDNSQTKLNPSTNDESQVKKDTFLIRGYASKYIEIRVRYNNKKLNFSNVSDSYTITNVMKKDSTINITIEWK